MNEYKAPTGLMQVFDPHDGDFRLHHVGVPARPRDKLRGYGPDSKALGDDWTADWTAPRWTPANTRGVSAEIRRVPLLDALTADHLDSDAHCVAYAMRAGIWLDRYPRVNKDGLSRLLGRGYDLARDVVLIDVDNPLIPGTGAGTGTPAAKRKNSVPGAVEHWVAQLDRVKSLGWGFYLTSGGSRIVIPLATSVYDADRYEGIVRGLMATVDTLAMTFVTGEPVYADTQCIDWTRWYRLPHVHRDNRFSRALHIDLSAMRAHDYEPVASTPAERKTKARVARSAVPYVHTATVPAELAHLIPQVDPSMLIGLTGGRHALFAACATVLLNKGVPPTIVPAVVAEMSRRMGVEPGHIPGDYDYAERTVERWRSGVAENTAFASVSEASAPLASALDALSVGILGDKLAEIARKRVAFDTVTKVSAGLWAQIEDIASVHLRRDTTTDDVIRVIGPPPGTGKTESAADLVHKVSTGAYVPPGESEKDAALMMRTAYVAPAMKNAADFQKRAHGRGLPMLRYTSPVSEREIGPNDKIGPPICRYHAHAVALGAINVKHALCDGGETKTKTGTPCIHRSTCLAATGAIALDEAGEPYAVEITDGMAAQWPHICATHARLGVALEHVGSAGTLIVDERPPLWEVVSITDDLLARVKSALVHFERDYADAAQSVISALRALIVASDLDVRIDLRSALPSAVVDGFAGYRGPDGRSPGAPPVSMNALIGARGQSTPAQAKAIGEAAEVLSLLWSMLQAEVPRLAPTCVVRCRDDEPRKLEACTTPDDVQAATMPRVGPTMILDADAHLYASEYARVISTPHPYIHSPRAVDGANVDRTIAITRLGVRSAVRTKQRQHTIGGRHVEFVQLAAKRLASSVYREHLIITWRALATIIRAAVAGVIDATMADDWREAGQHGDLKALAEELRPVIATIPGKVFVLHYGQERGDDRFRACPSVVTMGDPIPAMDAMATVAMHLGLSESDAESLGVRATRAQLGQAVDRIRPSRRSTPASMLHIGSGAVGEAAAFPLYPAGWEGRRFTVDSEAHYLETRSSCGKLGGRPANTDEASASVRKSALLALRVKLKTGAACAKALGIGASTECKYAGGSRTIPDDVSARVNALLTSNDASTAIAA